MPESNPKDSADYTSSSSVMPTVFLVYGFEVETSQGWYPIKPNDERDPITYPSEDAAQKALPFVASVLGIETKRMRIAKFAVPPTRDLRIIVNEFANALVALTILPGLLPHEMGSLNEAKNDAHEAVFRVQSLMTELRKLAYER